MRVWSLDREGLVAQVTALAARLAREFPEVVQVVLFGSAAEGRALPSSDVDLLVVVSSSQQRFLERADRYRPLFEPLEMGLDLFVYTSDEAATVPLARGALAKGRTLFARAGRGT